MSTRSSRARRLAPFAVAGLAAVLAGCTHHHHFPRPHQPGITMPTLPGPGFTLLTFPKPGRPGGSVPNFTLPTMAKPGASHPNSTLATRPTTTVAGPEHDD